MILTSALHNSILKHLKPLVRFIDTFNEKILNFILPKGLYARALIIIIAPMVLLQFVLLFVFMERHWETVTRRLSTATVNNINLMLTLYDTSSKTPQEQARISKLAKEKMNLEFLFLPRKDLPPIKKNSYFALLEQTLSSELARLGKPFWLDVESDSGFVDILIQLDTNTLRIRTQRSHTYASNSHIFLVWMFCSSMILLGVAILFLRNQIKPILRLSVAAKAFGMGRSVPDDFEPRGAREVRDAASAFLLMRDRIERHVEQRTTMLAGVSHDLRTILTRFKLQLAFLKETPETEAMRSDILEMQHMLDDYMAFAKGDSGEETVAVDVNDFLEEVCADSALLGADIQLTVLDRTAHVQVRRNALKRCLMNLVTNAIRYGDEVHMKAHLKHDWLYITVEDNGPGIPEDKREEVFRPFYRLDESRNQDQGNSGLGLSIASDIAHAHGGRIILKDSRLGGLRAILKIPV